MNNQNKHQLNIYYEIPKNYLIYTPLIIHVTVISVTLSQCINLQKLV